MNALRLSPAILLALLVAACGIGKPPPSTTTYVVEPAPPTAGIGANASGQSLRMGSVRVAAAFARTALVYRVQESQYTADAYNAFIAEPAAMLGNEIASWLNNAGRFKSVSQPGATQPSPLVLEVTVTELYGDFRPQQTPAAVLSAQFNLIDTTQPRAKVVLERTLSSRIPLQQASPDALVQGYGRALGDVLTQFIAALNART
jgi:uncharacterized lipoprotein YmbA